MSHRIKPGILVASAIVIALSVAPRPSAAADAEARLRNHGAEFERDDDGNVTAVSFGFDPVATSADLWLLAKLPSLQNVDLSGITLRGTGLSHLASLPKLKTLHLDDTKCCDADLEHIGRLTALEELGLAGTSITDRAIPKLTSLRQLKWVDFSSSRVTPAGIRNFRQSLPNTYVNQTWAYMATFVNGRGVLDMDHVSITFDGIRGAGGGGGGGGGSIQVSCPVRHDDEPVGSVGEGGAFGFSFELGLRGGVIRASASREKGVPTIRVGEHRIEIKDEGTKIIVNGQAFRLGAPKLHIVVTTDGVPKALK